jgi:DNA-binding MarR family transcriptional regulator
MAAPSGFLAGTGAARTPAPDAAAGTPAPDPADCAPAPDPADCTLSNDLGWALGVVFRGYVKATHEALADLPGGPRGYQVLAAAAGDEHGSQLALAQHLGVDRTVMTYLLDDLEAARLIERRPDPTDRRARRIVATPDGRSCLTRLDERLRAAEEQLLSGLDTGPDRQVFRTLLRRLALHASAGEPVRTACDAAADVARMSGPAGGPGDGAAGRPPPAPDLRH